MYNLSILNHARNIYSLTPGISVGNNSVFVSFYRVFANTQLTHTDIFAG
jgi:hypothetical protein